MRAYTVRRQDRNRRGVGVLVTCKEDIDHHQMNTDITKVEVIGIFLQNGPTIISAYVPPSLRMRLETNDLNTMFNTSNTVIPTTQLGAAAIQIQMEDNCTTTPLATQ